MSSDIKANKNFFFDTFFIAKMENVIFMVESNCLRVI